MSTSNRLLAAALLVPPLILLQQHLRLQSRYPTHRTTPCLEISPRTDTPATAPAWRRTHAGDEWTADVPRALLGDGSIAPEVVFARAFWGSWPLKLERSLVQFLARNELGPFAMRDALGEPTKGRRRQAERDFEPGAQVIGGLFMVEAHDAHPIFQPDPTIAGPLVCSWWLHPSATTTTYSGVGIAGGYHSFTVKDIVSNPATPGQDLVRLSFTSHLVLINHPDPSQPSIPSRSLAGLSKVQKGILYFHQLYSRVLLDLSVRSLQSGAVWSE